MYIQVYVYICACILVLIYIHMSCCLSWAKTLILQKLWRNLLPFGNFGENLLISYTCILCNSGLMTRTEFCALTGNCAAVRFLSAFTFKKQ